MVGSADDRPRCSAFTKVACAGAPRPPVEEDFLVSNMVCLLGR